LIQGTFAMQERPAQGVPPDTVQNNAPKRPLGDSFLAGKRYPGEAPPPPSAPPAGPPSGRLFTRVVLPLLIFIGAIGALAWVTQYLPNRKGPEGDKTAPPPPKLTLKFASSSPLADWEPEQTKVQWEKLKEQAKRDGKDLAEVPPPQPAYAAEYEVTSETHRDGGHYDFAFANPNKERVVVGLESKNCQCASVAACTLDSAQWALYQKKAKADPITRSRQSTEDGLPWKLLSENSVSGVMVDPGQHGIIRVFWDGRNQREPKGVSLAATISVSPLGRFHERTTTTLGVRVHYVQPVNFYPERLNLGSVSPQNPSAADALHCWSATRDLEVEVGPGTKDPCFEVRARKLEKPEELRQLTDDLRAQGIWTRVRSAYRIEVTVYEEKDGKQFDLGTFARPLNLVIKGKREGAEAERLFPSSLPSARGRVQGDIKVGTFEDDGAINLKNVKADRLNHVKARLWAKAGMELEYDDHFTPEGLNLQGVNLVDLEKGKKASLRGWKVWEIQLSVPPGLEPGPLPEDSAIFLRVKGPTPRRIRIPLIGSVVRG
jgi:hypothetical protein